MSVLDKLKLDGKVAVVTGAGRGLGRAMTLALADAGADLVAAVHPCPEGVAGAAAVPAAGRAARPLAPAHDLPRNHVVGEP